MGGAIALGLAGYREVILRMPLDGLDGLDGVGRLWPGAVGLWDCGTVGGDQHPTLGVW